MAAPATARLHVTVMAEERLADTAVRAGIFEFTRRLQPFAETALISIGHRTTTLVDYTTDLDAMVAGLNRLRFVPQAQSNFTEALLDISQKIERRRPERPVIVVVTRADDRDAGPSAKDVLDRLRRSGAIVYAVAIVAAPRTGEPLPTVDDRLVAEPSRRAEVLEGGTNSPAAARCRSPRRPACRRRSSKSRPTCATNTRLSTRSPTASSPIAG